MMVVWLFLKQVAALAILKSVELNIMHLEDMF